MIKITFLGTSGSIPTAKRNHSAILISYANENILIDCGEGTQRQFKKAKINPLRINRLLITHWHGDHVLGIPGLLQTLALNNYRKTLYIYGPRGTKKYMKQMLETFVFVGKISLNIKEINNDGKFLETGDFYVEARRLFHGIPTNAYIFVKKGQLKIDKKKLGKAGLPYGPLLQKLKQGKDIIYKGKKYLAKNLTYMAESKKISIVLDTGFDNKIINYVKNSNLLVCEANFGSELIEKAKDYRHLTAKQAAEIAKKSKSKKLALTHLSQRYDKVGDEAKILNDAQKVFKNSHLAKDLDVLTI